MEEELFRKKALEKLNSPQNLSEYVKVTSPSVYLVIGTLLLLAIGLVLWSFYGTVTDKVNVSGVVFPAQGTVGINIPNAGVVRTVYVHRGDHVNANQTVALVSIDQAYSIVTAPYDGTVLNYKAENDHFEAFESLVNLIPDQPSQVTGDLHSAASNHIIAFVDFQTQRKLKNGMEVQVSPSNLPREKFGYITGEIVRLSQYPVDKKEVQKRLQVEEFANDIMPTQGSAFEIEIELHTIEGHPDQYAWSTARANKSSSDLDKNLSVGSFCDVQIVTRKTNVVSYLFNDVKQKVESIR